MAVLIAGHQRSGTSILQLLCGQHPEIGMTMEFVNFLRVGDPVTTYLRDMWRRWPDRSRQNSPLVWTAHESRQSTRFNNNMFFARYMLRLLLSMHRTADVGLIETTLKRHFPKAKVVGDKFPDYIFHLDRLSQVDGLEFIVLYRDVKDVVSSTLLKVRGDWRGLPFTQYMDTAEKVAHRWVTAIENMMRHSDRVFPIRYEDLVQDPLPMMSALGEWLNVDPGGFPESWLKADRMGKHKDNLTDEEIARIMDIAGATMAELGYS